MSTHIQSKRREILCEICGKNGQVSRVEAQCTPSRSALLTGRHPLRSGTQIVPITGGPDGLTRWEVTIAQALSDAGYGNVGQVAPG